MPEVQLVTPCQCYKYYGPCMREAKGLRIRLGKILTMEICLSCKLSEQQLRRFYFVNMVRIRPLVPQYFHLLKCQVESLPPPTVTKDAETQLVSAMTVLECYCDRIRIF